MKLFRHISRQRHVVTAALLALTGVNEAVSATITKANNSNNLNSSTSWSGGTAPGSGDIARWNNTVSGANATVLGANLSWQGIEIVNPGGAVTINAGNTLTLGLAGINMSAATQNLTLNVAIALGASQTFNVASSRTLLLAGTVTGSGNTITKDGAGTLQIGVDNIFSNVGMILNAGTLQLTTGNNQTRTFSLASLAGTGGTIWQDGNNSPVTLTVGSANTSTSFAGKFAPGGNGNTTFTLAKTGAGVLTLSGDNSSTKVHMRIDQGVLRQNAANSLGGGTLQLNGGVLGLGVANYAATLGTGNGNIRFSGSGGFAAYTADRTVNLSGGAALTWNSTANFLTTGNALILGAEDADRAVAFQNAINFNGAARTVQVVRGTGVKDASLSGILSGTGSSGLTITGGGILELSGNNTFAGTLSIQNATVQVASINNESANGVFGNSANAVALGSSGNTGTIQYTGSTTSSTKKFTLSASGTGNFQIDSANLTLSGLIDGSGALAKTGAGTLILTGGNTYGGGTTVNDGTLQIGAGSNTGSLGVGAVAVSSTLAFNRNDTFTVANTISGPGAVMQNGTGALILSGNNNSFTGNITVTGGTLQVGHASALGTVGGSTVVSSGAVLDLSGYNIGSEPVSLTGGALANSSASTAQLAGTLTVTGNSSFSGTGDFILSGAISGTGSLTKNGANTATLSGSTANTMSGIFTVTTGTFILDKTGVHAIAGDLTVAGGTVRLAGTGGDQISDAAGVTVSSGTLDVNGKTETIGALSGMGNIILGGGILTIADGSGANFSGSITGTGSLTKSGAGTQFLSGMNLYGGPTMINGGTLAVDSDANLGVGSGVENIVINGGALAATTGFVLSSTRGVAVGATNTTYGIGTISVAGGQTLTYNGVIANNGTIAGVAGGLVKEGAGTLVLGGSNTFSGVTIINAGTLLAGTSGMIAALSGVTVSSGAVLNVGAYNQLFGSLAGTGTIINNAGLVTGSNNTSAVFSGVMSGSGSLTKVGGGVQELTQTSSYSGGTKINGGTLKVNNATGSALGAGAVTVNSGGTLGGTGTVAGAVSVNSGGHLAAGNSVGTQNYGSLTLNSNSYLDVEFKSDASANDLFIVDSLNGLSIGSGVKVNLYKEFTTTPFTDLGVYNLINYSGTVGGTGASGLSVNNPAINRSYSFGVLSGTTNWITLTIGGRGVGWVGHGADANWTTMGNWQTNGVSYAIQALDQLVFDGTTKENNNNDFAVGTRFNGIVFTNTAGAFVLNGNRVNLVGDVINRSANTQTVNLDLVLDISTRNFNTGNGKIIVNGVISETGGTQGLTKTGGGELELTGANSYHGTTEIAGGVLRANDGAGLPAASHLKISDGVLESIGAASFTRNLGTLSGQFQWAGSGGFAARGGKLTVTVNDNPSSTMVWGSTTGFLGNGDVFIFGANDSDHEVEFRNPVNLNGAARTVQVSNTGYATLSGTISGSGGSDLIKTGSGNLVLTGNDTYSGATTISDGKLTINGTLSSGGGAVIVDAGASLAGSGYIGRQVGGAGSVDPGNSPGVLTVTQVDPAGGLDFNFEFTRIGSPNYANVNAISNDLLRITSATPFISSLSAADNTINLFLNTSLTIGTNVFRGGFYTDSGADFLGTIANAGFNIYATGGSGDKNYNGVSYTLLSGSMVSISTVAEIGPGGVNGRVMQFGVNFEGWSPTVLTVPEPSVLLLWGVGFFTIYAARRRDRKKKKL
jgi:fibronectin-binding autotransporter adhesin